MKFLPFILLVVLTACSGKSTSQHDEKSKQDTVYIGPKDATAYKWSYENLSKTILEVFPEAYPEFLEITFSNSAGVILPTRAEFLIPAVEFEKNLTEKVLDERAKLVLEKMEMLGCEGIKVGDPVMYSYYSWEDKFVRRVTFYYGFGC